MRRNTPLIAALALCIAWTGVTGAFDQAEPRDLKAEFAFSGVADVADEALAAMIPGVGLPCTAGFAGPYPCEHVDLLGLVTLAEMRGAAGNDSWGWTHTAEDGTVTELAIMGTGLGAAFIDVTDPVSPTVIATVGATDVPTAPVDAAFYANGVVWRDMKVANDHAFIVSEQGGGMQVVDLRAVLDHKGAATPATVEPVAVYTDQGAGAFHNIAINEATDTAFLVGGNFSGGLHMVDVSDPANPTFAGSYADDGYTHDAQCVLYAGPDPDYNGTLAADGQPSELCFAFNEDTVSVVDVTDRDAPALVTRIGYDPQNSGTGSDNPALPSFYAHQGWLTPDQQFVVFNDELDEQNTTVEGATGGTRTYMVELVDLDANDADGTFIGADVQQYRHATLSTDHNLYIVGDLIFEANYNAGLRILRYTPEGLRSGELEEVGSFDVDPGLDAPHYGGAWNVYPFFESGTILVSSLDEGLYTLRFTDPAVSAVPVASSTAGPVRAATEVLD